MNRFRIVLKDTAAGFSAYALLLPGGIANGHPLAETVAALDGRSGPPSRP